MGHDPAGTTARDPRVVAALAASVGGTAWYLLAAGSQVLAWRAVPLLVALAGYGAVVALAWRGRPPAAGAVVAAAAGLVALAVAIPPLHSRDVYLYGMQGRLLAVHGESPYRAEPDDVPGDPLLPHVSKPFRDGHSYYGPAFTVVEAAGAVVAGDSPTRTRLVFQGLAAAGLLASLAVVARLGAGAGGLAFLGLNPVVVAKGVNEGHVDVLVGLLVLVGVAAATRRRATLAAAVLAVAALVKVVALVAVAALVVWAAGTLGRRAAVRVAAVAGGIVVAGYVAAGGPVAVAPLGEAAMHQSRASIWAQPRTVLTGMLTGDGVDGVEAGETASLLVSRLALLTVAALAAVLVLAVARRPSPAPAVGAALVAYLLASVYVPAWYVAGALPTLALVWRSRVAAVAAAHGALLAVVYVYSAHLGDDPLAPWFRGLYRWVAPALEVGGVALLIAAAVGRRGGAGGGARSSRAGAAPAPTPPPRPAPAP